MQQPPPPAVPSTPPPSSFTSTTAVIMTTTRRQLDGDAVYFPLLHDPLWRSHVKKLLESPPVIDFQDERWTAAADNNNKKEVALPKMIPSDEQCRYLWRFYRNNNNKNSSPSASDDEIKQINNDNVKTALTEGTSETVSIKKNEASVNSAGPFRKRKRQSVSNNDHDDNEQEGWISKRSILDKEGTLVSNEARDRCQEYNKSSTNSDGTSNKDGPTPTSAKHDSTTNRRTPSSTAHDFRARNNNNNNTPHAVTAEGGGGCNNSCGSLFNCSNRVRNSKRLCLQHTDASPIDLPSPEGGGMRVRVVLTAESNKRRKKRRRFRPTAKRAEQRLKQRSIRQMFGSR